MMMSAYPLAAEGSSFFTITASSWRYTPKPNFQLIEHECDRDAQGVYRHPAAVPEVNYTLVCS